MDKVYIVLALCFCHTATAQAPAIVGEILPEVKPVGGTARLNCTVANKQNQVVMWLHKDNDQIISFDEDIDVVNPIEGGETKYDIQKLVQGNLETYQLIIRRIKQQDAGLYECSIRVQGITIEQWPRREGLLTVTGM